MPTENIITELDDGFNDNDVNISVMDLYFSKLKMSLSKTQTNSISVREKIYLSNLKQVENEIEQYNASNNYNYQIKKLVIISSFKELELYIKAILAINFKNFSFELFLQLHQNNMLNTNDLQIIYNSNPNNKNLESIYTIRKAISFSFLTFLMDNQWLVNLLNTALKHNIFDIKNSFKRLPFSIIGYEIIDLNESEDERETIFSILKPVTVGKYINGFYNHINSANEIIKQWQNSIESKTRIDSEEIKISDVLIEVISNTQFRILDFSTAKY